MATMIAEPAAPFLREVFETLEGGQGEAILDLSSVPRVDAAALAEMEQLADAADARSVQVRISGVNVDVYKVLKLVNLAPRFKFVA